NGSPRWGNLWKSTKYWISSDVAGAGLETRLETRPASPSCGVGHHRNGQCLRDEGGFEIRPPEVGFCPPPSAPVLWLRPAGNMATLWVANSTVRPCRRIVTPRHRRQPATARRQDAPRIPRSTPF